MIFAPGCPTRFEGWIHMFGLRRAWTRRTAQITAAGLLAASGSMFFASTALAAGGVKPPAPGGGGAGGNNGTVKLGSGGVPFTNANDPHLQCPIQVQWSGFDPGTQTFDVGIVTTSPTGGTVAVSGDPVHGTFNVQPFTQQYSLSFSGGANPNNKGEYHVSITVNTTSSTGSSDVKHKTVWVGGCAAAPAGGSVTVTGACTTNTANSTYTWTIHAVPANPGGGNAVTGTWTPPAGGTWPDTVGGTTFVTPSTVNPPTMALDAAFGAWTLTQPSAVATPCVAANKTISVTGTCNGANNGYTWQLSTTPSTSGVTGTFAPHSTPANTTGFTTNGSGVTPVYTTGLADNSIDFVVSTGGWSPASGTVNATANCVNNPQPGQVKVDGQCNTTTQGYDWTVSTTPAAAGVDGTWAPSGGGAKTGWSTDATGQATFSSGVGENHLDITVTTGNWNGPAAANATACGPAGQAAPVVTEANHCASGMNLTLSNMNGTAPATFTVVAPDGTVQTVTVNAGQLKKLIFAVKEDTTGTVSVTVNGGSKQAFAYHKNCATVLGIKHTRKPSHKPSQKPQVKGEHQQLPFTGFDTKRALLDGSVVFFLGAVLCILGARRREEEPLYY